METCEAQTNNVVPILQAIEGGRVIEANKVHAEFAKQTQELTVDTPMMAGFAVLVWNDEGELETRVFAGDRNPFSLMLIPGFASTMLQRDVLTDA